MGNRISVVLQLTSSLLGVLAGFVPIFEVNSRCMLAPLSYCQGLVKVYVDAFERIRDVYIALLFVSVFSLIIVLPSLLPRLRDSYRLPLSIQLTLATAQLIASAAFTITTAAVSPTYVYTITKSHSITATVTINIEKLPWILIAPTCTAISATSTAHLIYKAITPAKKHPAM